MISEREWHSDAYDGPEAFTEAAGYLAEKYAVSQRWAAQALSDLARIGLIVSTRLHDEISQSYADQLSHASAAADELVRQLHGDTNGDSER